MRVLVVGSGAREHAICLALAADPCVERVDCAPGNAGIADVAATHPLDVDGDPAAIVALAGKLSADLVVIGPEDPLVNGATDLLRAAGIACFGPSAAAARIEGSKGFAKDVMASAGVPTAAARTCGDSASVEAALAAFGTPYVVKDDGLAAGKGVVVTTDRAEAQAHAQGVLAAGHVVVVEEYLGGPEVSLFAVTDGEAILALLPAQDFKRAGDGDTGPNTGGMGAYAPLPWLPPHVVDDVVATILGPTVAELARRGTPYCGLLYAGLVMTPHGPKVIEFNARFGDPETQVVLALLESPLAVLLQAAATGTLAAHPPLRWSSDSAVVVVLAAAGYPGPATLHDEITGAEGALHAGTRRDAVGTLRSSRGRVLSVIGRGPTLAQARDAAYAAVAKVRLAGSWSRGDIAATAARGEISLPSRGA